MRHTRIAEPSVIAESKPLGPQKHLGIRPIEFFEIAMLWAGLFHKDLAVFLEHASRDTPGLLAVWTERLYDFWEAFGGWRNWRAVIRCLGLLGRIGII
jgi:hypothetical protein